MNAGRITVPCDYRKEVFYWLSAGGHSQLLEAAHSFFSGSPATHGNSLLEGQQENLPPVH